MNTAMQMMPMPMMMGGMMNPMMSGSMTPMPMMTMPMMMGCQMKCTMTPNGMTCEMMPLNPSMKDMFMKCCEGMMNMMQMGMPMMVNCGGMMMMCMPMKARRLSRCGQFRPARAGISPARSCMRRRHGRPGPSAAAISMGHDEIENGLCRDQVLVDMRHVRLEENRVAFSQRQRLV